MKKSFAAFLAVLMALLTVAPSFASPPPIPPTPLTAQTVRATGAYKSPASLTCFLGSSLYQLSDGATISGGNVTGLNTWTRGEITWLEALSLGRINAEIWADPSDPYYATTSRGWKGANRGLSNDTMAGFKARQSELPKNCSVLWLDGATNSISSVTAISDVPAIVADAMAIVDNQLLTQKRAAIIVDGVRSRRILDCAGSTCPVGQCKTSCWAAGSIQRLAYIEYNRQLEAAIKLRRMQGYRVYYYDTQKYWGDFSDAYGQPRAGWSNDGIHNENMGGYWAGLARWNFVQSVIPDLLGSAVRIPGPEGYYNASTYPYGFLGDATTLAAPFHLGTGGTAGTGCTGTVPQYSTCKRNSGDTGASAVSSIVTQADPNNAFYGRTWQIAITCGTAYADFLFYPGKNTFAHNLAAGTWVQGYAYVNVSAYSDWDRLDLELNDSDATGVQSTAFASFQRSGVGSDTTGTVYNGGYSPYPNAGFYILIKTVPFQVKAGSNLTFQARAACGANGSGTGTSTIQWGPMWVQPVGDPNVLWYQ